ncbi:MAG: hypothetical protein LR008_00840 [Candidatus Pacebacteria bacterium]|nr:hypothetical protein [Candidatus Paceibacterota bacterium]
MSYNNVEFPQYVKTAGKVTVLTAISGLLVFMVAFIFDVGTQEFNRVSAQSASTTLTVLNTPPSFTLNPYEVIESSTSTPTNSGVVQQWSAIGTDSNNAPYFLLICSTDATPTANAAVNSFSLGTAPPDCDAGAIQWGVSASTTSGALASVSTTTEEAGTGQFLEIQDWYAWVCDDDPIIPACNLTPEQGDYATSSSPFNVNNRPVLTNFYNDAPADPGATFNFLSTSTDPDIVGGEDDIFLIICNSNTDYNTVTNTCPNDFIASTTVGVVATATAAYALPSVIRDDVYPAYGYLVDEHGHEALANAQLFNFVVNNVAPTIVSGDIDLNGGTDMIVSVEAGETTGFTLDFTARDANSCNDSGSSTEMELANFGISIFRSGVGSSTCDATGTNYDPNNCYDNAIGSGTWNLSCSASTTCMNATQDHMEYACTFPLWFVADPTDPGTPEALDDWSAAVFIGDNNFATSSYATSSIRDIDVISFAAIDILAADIAYGGIAPGSDSGTLTATSVLQNVGNTGLDEEIRGESMCGTYSLATECPVSATSTIPAFQQEFASTSGIFYGSGQDLASTTDFELELNANKTTSTSTPLQATTYWGIAVPASITLSGSYTGLNTFTAVVAEPADW